MELPFRLGRVLRVREMQRRLRQQKLAQLAAQRTVIEGQWFRARQARERVLEDEAKAAEAMVLDGAFLRLSRRFEAALAAQEEGFAEAAREVDRHIVAERDELVHQRREERKLLELAARHRERVAIEKARAVERHLDDLALANHRRTAGEERRGGASEAS